LTRSVFLAAVLAMMLAALPAAATQPACHSPAEIEAMRVRQLQIDLWLAASKCSETGGTVAVYYNVYVERSRRALTENGKLLNEMFARRGKGVADLDHYLTAMANDAQIRSQSVADYCRVQTVTLERAAALTTSELPAFAAEIIPSPFGAAPCHLREAGR